MNRQTDRLPRIIATIGVAWLLGVSASTLVSAGNQPTDPIAYDKCFADSNCGLTGCGGDMCNCCWNHGSPICFDGSCLDLQH